MKAFIGRFTRSALLHLELSAPFVFVVAFGEGVNITWVDMAGQLLSPSYEECNVHSCFLAVHWFTVLPSQFQSIVRAHVIF